MPVTINGSGGFTANDGSAAAPPIAGTDSNTGIFFPAADTIAFAEGGAEVARFDSSGNFGIGVTPSAWVSNFKAFQVGTGGTFYGDYNNTTSYFGNNAYFNGTNWKYVSSSYALYAYQDRSAGKHVWAVAASGTAGNNITWTEAMTLDSSGNLLVGTTSVSGLTTISANSNVKPLLGFLDTNTSSTTYRIVDFNRNGTQTGTISINNTNTTYATSSDYRLKEDVQPMVGGLARVAALKPVTYKWKVDGSDGEGFIAHELAEVVPQAVTGEKDAVETYTDEEGKEQTRPVYQGIDTSFLVATLTAAIQEQQAIIESLTARIAALEAK